MLLSRRSFFSGLVTAIAAPAIVRASSLMPVKVLELPPIPDALVDWKIFTPDGDIREFILKVRYHIIKATQIETALLPTPGRRKA